MRHRGILDRVQRHPVATEPLQAATIAPTAAPCSAAGMEAARMKLLMHGLLILPAALSLEVLMGARARLQGWAQCLMDAKHTLGCELPALRSKLDGAAEAVMKMIDGKTQDVPKK